MCIIVLVCATTWSFSSCNGLSRAVISDETSTKDFLLLPAQIFSFYIRRIRSQSRVDFDSIFYRRICCFANDLFSFFIHSVVAWIFSAACLKKASILSLIGALNESHRARLVRSFLRFYLLTFLLFPLFSLPCSLFHELAKWISRDFRGSCISSVWNWVNIGNESVEFSPTEKNEQNSVTKLILIKKFIQGWN